MGKLIVLAAGTVGYVLGARAGRERYEQIKTQAQRVWRDPKVQQAADKAEAVVKDKAPALQQKAAGAADKAGADKAGDATGSPAHRGEPGKSNGGVARG